MWCALKLRCEWQSMASQGLVISLLSLYFFNVNTLASARSCAVEWSWVRAAQRSLKYYPSDVVWDLMHLPNHIMFPQCSYMYSSEWAFLIECISHVSRPVKIEMTSFYASRIRMFHNCRWTRLKVIYIGPSFGHHLTHLLFSLLPLASTSYTFVVLDRTTQPNINGLGAI